MGLEFQLASVTFACSGCHKRYRIPIEAVSYGHDRLSMLCSYCNPKIPEEQQYLHLIDILRLLKRNQGIRIDEIQRKLSNWPLHIIEQSLDWLLNNFVIDLYQDRYFYRQLYR